MYGILLIMEHVLQFYRELFSSVLDRSAFIALYVES